MGRRLAVVTICSIVWLAAGCSSAPRTTSETSSAQSPAPTPSIPARAPTRRHELEPSRSPASVAPVSEEDALAANLAKLRKGRLAYAPPTTIKMDETQRITARIGSEGVSVDTLTAGLNKSGQAVDVVATPVSTKMKMTLTGSDFDIKALSTEEQFVDDTTPTEWSWDVQPKHSGRLTLHLAAVVEVGSLAKDYATVDREIKVEVNPAGALVSFFNQNWQKALYTILGVLGAAFWKWWLDRKKKPVASGAT